MQPKSIAIIGAAETTRMGVIPDTSQIQLHADAALNAMADAGLKPADIDGIATAGETPVTVAHYLGLTPKWVDGTAVGGCSFMIHVRHAAAAIASGLCETVLITHGESGRSGVGRTRNVVAPTSLAGQFEQPYGPMGPPTLFTIPVLRYMKTYGLTHEQLAMVSVVQREWAAKNPRATFKPPITVEDVRPFDDLRRLRASADLRPRRSRLCAVRRGRRLHRRAQHRSRRQAAAQHQWRRPLLHDSGMYRMYAL
jgi:acetyl-CoA acetyltransferase